MPVTSPPPAPLPSGTSPNVAKEPGYTEACLEAPAEEFVDVVDELDRVLKCVARSTLVDGVDRWRVVAVVWFDALGNRVLLAQRSAANRMCLRWAAKCSKSSAFQKPSMTHRWFMWARLIRQGSYAT